MKRFFSHFPAWVEAWARRDLAGGRKEQRNGVLGGRDRVAERRVHDHDAASGGRRDVDVIHTDAGTTDDLESGGGGNDVLICLRRGSNRQAIVTADDVQ